jgi:hypothetical protein
LFLCALMYITISAPSINLSISMLFHILHILSILTGPNTVCHGQQRKIRGRRLATSSETAKALYVPYGS